MKEKMKVIWAARHPLTGEQISDLKKKIKNEELEIIQKTITWRATNKVHLDVAANNEIWMHLEEDSDIITGVFPPVALEAKPSDIQVYSPVSAQEKRVREDGTTNITFVHVRWSEFN